MKNEKRKQTEQERNIVIAAYDFRSNYASTTKYMYLLTIRR